MKKENKIRKEIFSRIKELYSLRKSGEPFAPGKTPVPYAGRVYDEKELINLVDSSLDFWLTEGRFAEQFSEKISDYLDIDNVILVNSGSSANLLAFMALTSPELGKRRIRPGDEVITVAAGFPTTVTPIIPPAVPYKAVGMFGPRDRMIAALEEGGRLIGAREGDVLDGRFILKKINRESIDFAFVGLPPEITRRIPIAGAAP